MARVLLVEPFHGGSHQRLVDTLAAALGADCWPATLPATKWHWRARTSALLLSQTIPTEHTFVTLFASSVLSLAELLGLRPDLARLHKVVYFHESQLDYPVRKVQERDFQFGYNQITTCLAADMVVFNSKTLLRSFLDNIVRFLNQQPDQRPDGEAIRAAVAAKSRVVYFPLELPQRSLPAGRRAPVHIVWPHRWEHDKDPQAFFRVIDKLLEDGLDFRLSVLGQTCGEVPGVFQEARGRLEGQVVAWGYREKEDFYVALQDCDVAVSTARHETYGVAMLEAAGLGCFPLVPNRLVYPELYPPACLYNTEQQLYKRLRDFCRRPALLDSSPPIEFERFSGAAPAQALVACLQLD